MTSLSTIPKPIYDTSFLLPKLRDSIIFPRNFSVSGPKIRPLIRSNVFKNSDQTQFLSEGQCSPTFDVPLFKDIVIVSKPAETELEYYLPPEFTTLSVPSHVIVFDRIRNLRKKKRLLTFVFPVKVIERMRTSRESQETKQLYLAMYSSVFGGITTDTAAMVIPIDDHMVHRGHRVFDTAAIMDGYLYELDQHLDRFLGSAAMAKIQIPLDREIIRRILIRTVSVSKCRKGSLRYWLSAGPGDFQLSPSGCPQAALYAIVIQDQSPPNHRGIRVVTSSIPIKPPQFAVMKSVNYLPNALSKIEAEVNDAYAAIWLNGDSFVAEGPNMNVAFVTKEKELLMPSFDKILSGCTAKRVLVLAANLVKEGKLQGIRVDKLSVEDGKRADEMMLIGSGVLVRSVVQWDGEIIGDSREGPVTQALLNLLLEDMKSGLHQCGFVFPIKMDSISSLAIW